LQPPHRRRPRLSLERLEDRALPSSYTAGGVADLISDINTANMAGGSNTITLTAATTLPYVLLRVDNSTNGANGLPVITSKDTLTIVGNGDTIERSSASGTPDFRLFDVAKGGSLTLENLTLQNGVAFGSGSAAEGGAIYNLGTLDLSGATVAGNSALGLIGNGGAHSTNGQDAAGGGIWSNGTLTLELGTLVNGNSARGGDGQGPSTTFGLHGGTNGGNASGGGLYVAGGTVTLTSTTLSSNTATGGYGNGYGENQSGTGFGGGLYVAGGTVTLSTDTVTNNTASAGGFPGNGYGGGLYLAKGGSTVYLDAFTVAHTINNTAPQSPNIFGSYILH
jgi:hypothetical protein